MPASQPTQGLTRSRGNPRQLSFYGFISAQSHTHDTSNSPPVAFVHVNIDIVSFAFGYSGDSFCRSSSQAERCRAIIRAYRLKHSSSFFREPKTPKARRLISMTPSLALQLREHKESQSALRLLNNKPVQQDDLIFSDLEGEPINPNTVTPAFNKIAKSVGLKLRLHDLRHTHATLMLKSRSPS